MKPIDRIERIIDYYNTNISNFEKSIGASNNSIGMAIRRKSTVKDDTLNSILNTYPDINAEWLLTGNGKMLNEESPAFVYKEDANVSKKFSEINTDELIHYIVNHFDELQNNKIFNLLIEKEVWKRQAE